MALNTVGYFEDNITCYDLMHRDDESEYSSESDEASDVFDTEEEVIEGISDDEDVDIYCCCCCCIWCHGSGI